MPTGSRLGNERRQAWLALVGAGRMGRVHARNLCGRVPSARLAAVIDRDRGAAAALAGRCGVGAFETVRQAVETVPVDGVVIAGPPGSHVGLVRDAAAARRPVLCEKPLGLDAAAAREAVELAAGAGIDLRVAFQRRFDPGWVALREALGSGRLGTLRLLSVSHRNAGEPPNGGQLGGVLVDLGVHDLDAARWLAGPVDAMFAASTSSRDSATLSLRFRSGALGLIDLDASASYGFECSAELVGTLGSARLGSSARDFGVAVLESGLVTSRLATDHAERHDEAYVSELDAFGCLVTGDPHIGDTGAVGDDAVQALQLVGCAARSLDRGRAVEVDADR